MTHPGARKELAPSPPRTPPYPTEVFFKTERQGNKGKAKHFRMDGDVPRLGPQPP